MWLALLFSARYRLCAAQLGSPRREFDERCHHVPHHPVLIADAAQARRQLNLYPMARGKIDGVVPVKSEPYAFVGDVVPGETLMEQRARRVQEGFVLASHDDPAQGAGLIPPRRGPVGFDDQAPARIEPQCETVPSEAVH